MLLRGKRIVVTGLMTRDSIAYACAEQAQLAGAEIVLTSFGRARRITERAASTLPEVPDVLELDVNSEADHLALRAELQRRWGRVDGVLHAVAFAPADALGGNFVHTPAESAVQAFRTSAFSLKSLTEALLPLLENDRPEGASVVALDFDASLAWPTYDWMGVSKAALEAAARYLAQYLGRLGIRVNLVAAGPLATAAAQALPAFKRLTDVWEHQSPLGWDRNDALPVALATTFMLSDWSRAITGEILHVDGGCHAMGMRLDEADSAFAESHAAAVVGG